MPRPASRRTLLIERVEPRLCMALSAGWDGPGQGDADLTYHLGEVPTTAGVSQAQFESTVQAALEVWAKIADITFTRTEQSGLNDSLDFTFASIDGGGGTLAQAYFPDDVNPARIAGDVQFDRAERWEVGDASSAAFDLMLVAVHEIGHALGLDHLHGAGSVMAATVSARQAFTSLAEVDRAEMLELYAPSRAANPTSSTIPTTPSTPTNTTQTNTTPTNTTPTKPTTPTQAPTNPASPSHPTTPQTPSHPRQANPWFRSYFFWYRWWTFTSYRGRATSSVMSSAAAAQPDDGNVNAAISQPFASARHIA